MYEYSGEIVEKEAIRLLRKAGWVFVQYAVLGLPFALACTVGVGTLLDKVATDGYHVSIPWGVGILAEVLIAYAGWEAGNRLRLQAHQLLALVHVNRRVDAIEVQLRQIEAALTHQVQSRGQAAQSSDLDRRGAGTAVFHADGRRDQ